MFSVVYYNFFYYFNLLPHTLYSLGALRSSSARNLQNATEFFILSRALCERLK